MVKVDDREAVMTQYVIYERPRDAPEHFVVRRWLIVGGAEPIPREHTLHATLEDARKAIPPGLIRFVRFPDDDPAIVEVWI